MRECHLKMICNDRGDARRERTLTSETVFAIKEGFEVHSALYGDGKSRYTDVTKIVKEWTASEIWPENWEELLYATRRPKSIVGGVDGSNKDIRGDGGGNTNRIPDSSLLIHSARYGVSGDLHEQSIDVTQRVRQLATEGSLDIVVNNSTLTPNENPFRGKKKRLLVRYSIDGGEIVDIARDEKDWLIIGPVQREAIVEAEQFIQDTRAKVEEMRRDPLKFIEHVGVDNLKPTPLQLAVIDEISKPLTACALNDYLIRRFSISPQRLRGPMPIELRDFHRNDLAQLFAELGFRRGAEIGVAEGNYSEILLKANPECELLLVDPWHHYSDNPQGKSKERHEFAYNETLRKTESYPNVNICPQLSMEAVRDVDDDSLDFCYIDAHHSYPYVMADIIEWTKKVRSGGIVALDDVYKLDEARWGAGPMEAIYDYTRAMHINPWWLIAAHKSVDGFFVKL